MSIKGIKYIYYCIQVYFTNKALMNIISISLYYLQNDTKTHYILNPISRYFYNKFCLKEII